MNDMFCFQCEQVAKGEACTTLGVCGKNAEAAVLQDKVVGALVNLANTIDDDKVTEEIGELVERALFHTVTNVDFDPNPLQKLIDEIEDCIQANGGKVEPFDLEKVWNGDEDIRSLKSLLLFGMKGMAAYAYHARVLNNTDLEVTKFFLEGLRAIGKENPDADALLGLVLKCGETNLHVMQMLDEANTSTYGKPEPTDVTTHIEPGPFIVMTGHDLYDLQLLLEQTKGTGVNVYTHGEMLPAHAYPELKKYDHLKGNFGTAWQNQVKEFDGMPGAVIFNTNCIQRPRESYADRVFTTNEVRFPGIAHLPEKDFTPAIEKAKELGGYSEVQNFTGINGGSNLMCGFGHDTVMSVAETLIDAIKAGDVSHIFLVGGCDGAKPGRNYYTNFVQQAPKDSLILTLACGKFRFNDIDLGSIGGIPRILDMGQCNDAYSAIVVAVELAKAFDCEVNDLPLSLVLSWYEQKAVVILLTLLSLGIKDIYLGPTLPAFISPNVLDILVENYNIHPTTQPEADLERILA